MTATAIQEASVAVAKAEQELAAARERLARVERGEDELTPEQLLAIDLHESLCHWNHTDGCGWHYEIKGKTDHQWDGYAHAKYLKKAEGLSERFPGLDTGFAADFLRAVKEL